MERQNIFTGIKLLPSTVNSAKQTNRQASNQGEELLSIKENNVIVRNKHNFKLFKFDCCLGKYETQQQIYDNFCLTMVQDFAEGYDSTLIFCGDNYNKNGYNDILLGKYSQETKGILPRFIDHITNAIKYFSGRKFMFKVSFLEINDEEMIDLLGVKKCKLQIKQDKVNKNLFNVNNLEMKVLPKIDQIESFYLVGNRKRQYAYSKDYRKRENSNSFFTVYLESLEENGTIYRSSRYVFCELSSNSFQEFKNPSNDKLFHTSITSKIMSSSQAQRMGSPSKNHFNLSNYSFQNIVNTIVYGEQSAHVPFHDSKVTKLLRQAFGGNMKTAILGMIETENSSELQKTFRILKTLQIASQIQNSPSNLKEQQSSQFCQNIVGILQQIHRLSNELDKVKVELQILTNNTQYVPKQVQKLKFQNGPSIIKDNQFCSEQHIEDHVLQEKTKKQWQLKQNIKVLQKNIKEKISYIQNLHDDQNQVQKDYQYNKNCMNQEEIIAKRKEILLRVKGIKQKRLNSIPNFDMQQIDRQKKRQVFALQIQFQKQRNLFTSNIRALEEKLSFYKQIAQSYLKKEEIQIIRTNCKYDETKRQFELPMFMLKEKKERPYNGQNSLSSQRKFIVSPRSKSYNSYHSINSGNRVMNFQKKIQNMLSRKPKPSDEYNLEYRNENTNTQSKPSTRILNKLPTSPITKLTISKSRQAKPSMNLNRMSLNRERNDKNKLNEHTKNVRSEYELGSVDINRVIKYNQDREKIKLKEKQKPDFTNNNQSGPFFLMKRQKLHTEPLIANSPQDTGRVLSPPRSSVRDNSIKSLSNKLRKWM